MAVQAVGIGSSANDGTGDPLRTAFNKINENFTEVYALLGQDTAGAKGIDISGSTIGSTETNADIIINPNGTGLVELAANVQIDNAIKFTGASMSSLVTNADITLAPSGTGDINLTAGADVNLPADIGLTFGNDAEKIEGDGTDLTISGNNINLTAVADVNIPSGVGLTFATAEKIESDGTDLSITVGAAGDINVPANIGMTFGDDGEKIEGDGTNLTIASSALLNLTAATDIVIPTNVGLHFTDSAEKIESNGTKLVINSGEDIDLTCASGDVNVPANIGMTFGDDGEKIEGNGTKMTISSSGDLDIANTGTMVISGSVKRALVTIAATDNITQIEHAGRVNLLGDVGGNTLVTLTLPNAVGSGLEYKFIVSVVNTSNYVIKVVDASDTIDGSVNILDADASAQTAFATVAASDTITLNGTTTGGGSIGDTITLTDIATNQYAVEGQLVCPTGSNPATPFSATVS